MAQGNPMAAAFALGIEVLLARAAGRSARSAARGRGLEAALDLAEQG